MPLHPLTKPLNRVSLFYYKRTRGLPQLNHGLPEMPQVGHRTDLAELPASRMKRMIWSQADFVELDWLDAKLESR